jgi:hypothetical protein
MGCFKFQAVIVFLHFKIFHTCVNIFHCTFTCTLVLIWRSMFVIFLALTWIDKFAKFFLSLSLPIWNFYKGLYTFTHMIFSELLYLLIYEYLYPHPSPSPTHNTGLNKGTSPKSHLEMPDQQTIWEVLLHNLICVCVCVGVCVCVDIYIHGFQPSTEKSFLAYQAFGG